jgi:hypothetical protein
MIAATLSSSQTSNTPERRLFMTPSYTQDESGVTPMGAPSAVF